MGALATDLKAALFEEDLRPKFASFVAGSGAETSGRNNSRKQ